MKQHLRNPKLWYVVSLIIVDCIFFMATNPNNVPSIALIVGLILLVATVYCLFQGVLQVFGFYIPVLRRQKRRLAVFFTSTAAVLLALQSIEQLSIRDALVIVPLALILYIYVSFSKTRPVR